MVETITKAEFELLLQGERGEYYQGRWEYFKHVVDLISICQPNKVLELGPGSKTIVKYSDIMVLPEEDAWGRPDKEVGNIYQHDAREKPWPINDKQYDLFIALQVWEHLGNKQSRAFREAIRISKAVILSFPYKWNCPKNNANYPEHHEVDEELIGDWTLGIKPIKIINVPRTGDKVSKGERIIYYWNFS